MGDVKITATGDGPYLVEGDVVIVDPTGAEIPVEGRRAWLCRCGGSKMKPLCDGSHKEIGFRASEAYGAG